MQWRQAPMFKIVTIRWILLFKDMNKSTSPCVSRARTSLVEGVAKATARPDFDPAMLNVLLVHLRFSARTRTARYPFATPSSIREVRNRNVIFGRTVFLRIVISLRKRVAGRNVYIDEDHSAT
jgi:hypothetical protein